MGTDEEIDAAVRTAIETLGPTGFILNACMYLYDDDVTWDRFMLLIDAWKRNACMKTTMSSRERILATCAHQPVDHVPLHLEVHPSYLQYDPQVATWRDQFERTDALLALGVDAMAEVWLPDPTFHPDVQVRTWCEERDGQMLLGKEYLTPAGPLRQVIKETPDLYTWHKINRNTRGPIADLIDGVGLLEDVNPSRSVEFLVKGPEDLPRMRYLFQPLSGDALDRWREDALYAKRRPRSAA